MSEPVTPRIISQQQYETYSTAWLDLLGAAPDETLQQAFQAPDVDRLTFVSFSIEQVVALVSTLGVHSLKARFLLVPTGEAGHSQFTIALFAADANGERVSAYYMAEPVQAAPVAGAAGTTTESPVRQQGQVPRELVVRWLTAWVNAPTLTPDLFTATSTPIKGYTFSLSDFLDPLFTASSLDGQRLLLNFGLHTYYGPEATAATTKPTQTFGLVLCLGALRPAGGLQGLPAGNEFYDVADCCPPGN